MKKYYLSGYYPTKKKLKKLKKKGRIPIPLPPPLGIIKGLGQTLLSFNADPFTKEHYERQKKYKKYQKRYKKIFKGS